MRLDEVIQALSGLPASKGDAVREACLAAQAGKPWVPNPGPQTEAYFCEADELLYGGQAGGGKSDLGLGLALTAHKRALCLRRTNKESQGMVERMAEILGTRDGWNSQEGMWRYGARRISISGCQLEVDKQKFKGLAYDLYFFDEVVDFLESQVVFITGWNRTTDPNQRCRVVYASNPPTKPEGLWVIKRFAAWLDPNHPNPAQPGELRWYTTDDTGKEIEVDGPGPHRIGGEEIIARSRTFLPAQLSDNPDLAATNYGSVLASLPKELREAYRDGKFTTLLKDDDFQVIPSEWIAAAQERWRPDGNRGFLMTAMGSDPAGGGADAMVIAKRYGGWYDELVSIVGEDTRSGSISAGHIVKHRRHNAPVVIDVGGGYGGATIERLKDNGVPYAAFNGSEASKARSRCGRFTFANKRAESYWRLREELDPDQQGGSAIALPPDPELRADLVAVHWKLTSKGILLEPKDQVRERLGRSPGKGDAVTMALAEGDRAAARAANFSGARAPRVVMHNPSRR